MKLFNYLLLIIILVSSCKNDEANSPVFPENYGEGMYVVTDMGVSFLKYTDSLAQVTNQIYNTVNNTTIDNPKKIKFSGTRAYVLGDDYVVTANVNTFEDRGIFRGFVNPVDFDCVSNDRLFVVDEGDSKVKVVDIERMEITSDIETGDSTKPVSIISNSYKSFVLNGGGEAFNERDSTVVSIEYKDRLVPLADFNGSIGLGYNPVSAIWEYNPMILCKGVYNVNNHSEDVESSLYKLNGWDNSINNSVVLSGIYNANNLIANNDASFLYFTANDGIYKINSNSFSFNLILLHQANVMRMNYEVYPITDTTFLNVGMLYMNDIDNPNTILKYNLYTSTFQDTIIVEGSVRDINFY